MSKELTEEEKQELEEAKAITWLKGQKIAKKNFNKKAFIAHQNENAQKEIEESNAEFADNLRRMNRSIQDEAKRNKKITKKSE